MVFFYLAINDEPFHITLYCKDGDPNVCAHDSLPIKFASNSLFFHCKREYQDGYIWLKCTVCDHWFHDDCDHMQLKKIFILRTVHHNFVKDLSSKKCYDPFVNQLTRQLFLYFMLGSTLSSNVA